MTIGERLAKAIEIIVALTNTENPPSRSIGPNDHRECLEDAVSEFEKRVRERREKILEDKFFSKEIDGFDSKGGRQLTPIRLKLVDIAVKQDGSRYSINNIALNLFPSLPN